MKSDEKKTKAQLIEELVALRSLLSRQYSHTARGTGFAPLDRDAQHYLDLADVIIIVISTDETIALINQKACDLLGYTERELHGKNFFSTLVPRRLRAGLRRQFKWLMSGKIELIQIQHENAILTKKGEEKTITWQTSVLSDELGCIKGMIASGVDITERKRAEERLRAMLFTDELTGLYNRRGFQEMARQQLSLSNRTGSSILLLYADVDGMKKINDSFGHHEGDRALRDAADILRRTFRQSDIIARVGGDEFVVLNIGSPVTEAHTIISRLEEQQASHNKNYERPYKLCLSTGVVASVSQFPCSIDEFIERADRLMYLNKKENGKRK